MAGWHLYDFKGCSDSQCWEAVSEGVGVAPIVITEFGDTDCDGGFSRPLMEWADSGAVSYLAWSWSLADCSGGPSLIETNDGRPTEFGRAVRDHLRGASPLTTPPLPYGAIQPGLIKK